jgi:hypothetical protein
MKNTEAQLDADYGQAVASLTEAAWDRKLLDVAACSTRVGKLLAVRAPAEVAAIDRRQA